MSGQKLVRFDWAMKYLLRNKANYDIVEGFLCALLDDNSIKVLEVLESETNSEYEFDKFNRVDVLVKDAQGRNIIIEIQNTRESDYFYRMVYYASKNISQSIERGDKYHKINKVISVNILYFDLGIGEDYIYHGKTEFHGLNSREIIGKDDEKVQNLIPKGAKHNAIEIFPEYYLIQVEKYKNVVNRAIDEWLYWFKNEKIQAGSTSKNIKKVEKKLAMLKMPLKERRKYEGYLEKLVSERDMFETSREEGREQGIEEGWEQGIEEGREQGIEEGREQGIEEGREQGIEEGREEGIQQGVKKIEKELKPIIKEQAQKLAQKKHELVQKEDELAQNKQGFIQSAKLLKQANIPIEQIQKATGLSKEEIGKL